MNEHVGEQVDWTVLQYGAVHNRSGLHLGRVAQGAANVRKESSTVLGRFTWIRHRNWTVGKAHQDLELLPVRQNVEWIVEISKVAPEPARFLGTIVDKPWLPESLRSGVYQRIVDAAQAKVAATFGEERGYAQNDLWQWQLAWVKYLIEHGDAGRAQEMLAALPESRRKSTDASLLAIRAAAKTGKLPAVLANLDASLTSSQLREAAEELTGHGDAASSRRLANTTGSFR